MACFYYCIPQSQFHGYYDFDPVPLLPSQTGPARLHQLQLYLVDTCIQMANEIIIM